MRPKKFKVAAILLLLLHVSSGLTITAFNDDSVDVIVSRGAVINYLPDLGVFTEMEYIFCRARTFRILTTKGLQDATAYTPEKINTKWFDTLRAVDVHSDSPTQDLKEAVGTEYLSELQQLLQEKLFRGLFTGDNGIINALAAFRAASLVDKKAFTDLSTQVSEFESETRKLIVDVLQKTEDVYNTIRQLQNQHYEYTLSIVGFKALVFNHQSVFVDLMKLLYVSNVYNMHFEASTECRSGKVSPVIVPPSLLIERLQALEAQMPVGMELLYPWTEACF
ncbi:unnamed protein product [Orchesella dallaii]|uniref:Uncharacterized protein n=1 Tax=Orchesella dallaii TaxID=48710 RepID=A0ABP1PZQ8_9HEXA